MRLPVWTLSLWSSSDMVTFHPRLRLVQQLHLHGVTDRLLRDLPDPLLDREPVLDLLRADHLLVLRPETPGGVHELRGSDQMAVHPAVLRDHVPLRAVSELRHERRLVLH